MIVAIDMAKKVPGGKIAAFTKDGDFVLNHSFAHRDDPKLFETLAKVRAAGRIDTNHWRSAKRGEI